MKFELTPESASQLRGFVPPGLPIFCSYVGGSLVDGFGNPTSDLDLLILTHGEPDLKAEDFPLEGHLFTEMPGRQIFATFALGRRLDLEFRSLLSVQSIANDLIRREQEGRESYHAFAIEHLQLIHDLLIGLPVDGQAEFERLHKSVPADHLIRQLVRTFGYQTRSQSEDAAGAIAQSAFGSALLGSRQALGSSVDAVLASAGQTNPKAKWRFEKLDNANLPEMKARYIELELDGSADRQSILRNSEARILQAQEWLMEAENAPVFAQPADYRAGLLDHCDCRRCAERLPARA